MNGRPFFSLLHSWTGRRPIPPPDSGRPLARLAVALAALLLVAASAPACGRSKSENRIKPILANLTLDPFTGSPNPSVYLEKVPEEDDERPAVVDQVMLAVEQDMLVRGRLRQTPLD